MSPGLSNGVWYVDSGAGLSITGDRKLFLDFIHSSDGPAVKFGDGVVQRSKGSGSIVLCSDKLPTPITLTNVLYIPHFPVNLLSVNAIAHSHHCTITFDRTSCIAMQASSVLWSFSASSDGVYKFASRPCECSELCTVSEHDYSPAFSLAVNDDGGILIPTTIEWLWHRRLGHPGYQAMLQ